MILTPKTYLDWTIDFGLKTKSAKPNVVKLSNPFYWTFLIGILSGMRTNEIAQLLVEDIIKKDNVWLINVDETKDKSVKTSSSIRKVPVHQTLVSLGFLDYVKIIKSKGVERVFPNLPNNEMDIQQRFHNTIMRSFYLQSVYGKDR